MNSKFSLQTLIQFFIGFLIVSIYFIPVHLPDEGIHEILWFLPLALIPLTGFGSWALTLRNKRHVPLPGGFWAFIVMVSIVLNLSVQEMAPMPLRRALFTFLPFLLAPALFQLMTEKSNRQSFRLIAQALLVVTLFEVFLQNFFVLPSLNEILLDHPGVLSSAHGLGIEDAYGFNDLKARIQGADLYGHFVHANLLSIALLILGAMSLAIRRRWFSLITLLILVKVFSVGVLTLVAVGFLLMFIPIFGKRFKSFSLVLFGMFMSLILWQQGVNEHLSPLFKDKEFNSISYRLSYWQSAREMSETFGTVGLGQYDRFAEMSRTDGGHYASTPHNGFLKLVAELGMIPAVAALLWLASLFHGNVRSQDIEEGVRRPILFGASLAFVITVFSKYSQFHMGHMVLEGELTQRWPMLDVGIQLLSVLIFILTLWGSVRYRVRIQARVYLFASFVILSHMFIDSDLFHPGVLILVFLLSSFGWQRTSAPSRFVWHFYPLICIAATLGIFVVMENRNDKSFEDPWVLENYFLSGEVPSRTSEAKQLLEKWQQLDPAASYPLWHLMASSTGQSKRQWVNKYLASRPSDPSHLLRAAHWLQQKGEAPDIVRSILDRVHELDTLNTLDRYRLAPQERDIFHKLREELAPKPKN